MDGSSTMYRNGHLVGENTFEEFIKFVENNPEAMATYMTWGTWDCRGQGGVGVGTSGRFTDLQIFGRILSRQELEDWTGCQKRLAGDLVSWDAEKWFINKTGNNSEVEYLDFETDVCDMRNLSHHFFPTRMLFQKSLELCQKVSGKLNV